LLFRRCERIFYGVPFVSLRTPRRFHFTDSRKRFGKEEEEIMHPKTTTKEQEERRAPGVANISQKKNVESVLRKLKGKLRSLDAWPPSSAQDIQEIFESIQPVVEELDSLRCYTGECKKAALKTCVECEGRFCSDCMASEICRECLDAEKDERSDHEEDANTCAACVMDTNDYRFCDRCNCKYCVDCYTHKQMHSCVKFFEKNK
jgi:hypothetical protein